ncbi:MAG: iron-sulfur cluster assembly scaffold protein [Peptococcaceae bacterium]|nr:iron-sulfur cluster assembly scaffold protein [Peptococcaceae bacterium]
MDYSYKVIEHFMCPRNVGNMPDADAEGTFGDVKCGDSLTVYIKVRDNIITDINYLVFGCAAAVAASSAFSVLAKGKTIDEALQITGKDVMEALDGLPESKLHCSVLGSQALSKAIENYRQKLV